MDTKRWFVPFPGGTPGPFRRPFPPASIAAGHCRKRQALLSLIVCALAAPAIGIIAFRALTSDRSSAAGNAQAVAGETVRPELATPTSLIEVIDMDAYEPEDTLRIEIPLDPTAPLIAATPQESQQINNAELDPLQLVVADGKMVMTGTARSELEAQDMADQASEVFGSTDIIRDFVIDEAAPQPSRGVVVQKPVAFASGSAIIKEEFKSVLDACADVMVHNSRLVMTISGHTDSTGDTEFNLELAEQRAEAVIAYYVEKGIEPAKFDTVAVGESAPTGSNRSAAGRETNRRADLEFQEVFNEVLTATDSSAGDLPTIGDSTTDDPPEADE